MPFRNWGKEDESDFTAFMPPGGFDFGYDAAATDSWPDQYAFPLIPGQEASWTPTSQQHESQTSAADSLSPLVLSDYVQTSPSDLASTASPLDQDQSPTAIIMPSMDVITSQRALSGGQRLMKPPQSTLPAYNNNSNVSAANVPAAQYMPKASNNSSSEAATQSFNASSRKQLTADKLSPHEQHASPESLGESADGESKFPKPERPDFVRTRSTDSAKVRHNIVERRYRENINAQVDVLRDSIVATMQAKDEASGTSSSRIGADELKRLTKAAVIAAATQQIKRARNENDRLLDENKTLQAQIQELEGLVKCGECPLMQLSVEMGLDSPPAQPP